MTEHRVLNICFHGVGQPGRTLEPGEDRYWITVDAFHRILDEVATWPAVRISFDDGNTSDIEFGLPALIERGLPATFFVLAGRFGAAGSLSEADVIELRRNGMTIGSHGMNHIPWRRMSKPVRDRELVDARRQIADVAGVDVNDAALPLGQYDRRLLSDLKAMGYRSVHTSDRRAGKLGRWLQPRFSVTRADTAPTLRESALRQPTLRRSLELSIKGTIKRLR